MASDTDEGGTFGGNAGVYSNVIRFLCPLVVTDAQLESGLAILESAIEACR